MKLNKIREILDIIKNDSVKDCDIKCDHEYLIVYEKSHVVSSGLVYKCVCLDCNEDITLNNEYSFYNNKSILIDATLDFVNFEIFESSNNKNNELIDLLKNKYYLIRENNDKIFIKSELEKVIEGYKNKKYLKRL